MDLVKIILTFILSALIVATPILGLGSEINHTSAYEISCCGEGCEMMMNEEMKCHSNLDHPKDDCKDNCKDSCYDHACNVVPQTIQSPVQHTEIAGTFSLKDLKNTDYYQDLILQQLIFKFWNPPKGL